MLGQSMRNTRKNIVKTTHRIGKIDTPVCWELFIALPFQKKNAICFRYEISGVFRLLPTTNIIKYKIKSINLSN